MINSWRDKYSVQVLLRFLIEAGYFRRQAKYIAPSALLKSAPSPLHKERQRREGKGEKQNTIQTQQNE